MKKETYKSKPWWLKSTLWITIVSVALFVLKYYGLIDEIPDDFALGAGAIALLKIVLFLITKWFFKVTKDKE